MALLSKKADRPAKVKREKKPRKSLVKYCREVFYELKKTTWPTRDELKKFVIAVLIFVLLFIGVVWAFDGALAVLFKVIV